MTDSTASVLPAQEEVLALLKKTRTEPIQQM